jgi:hypothetical protein
MDTHQPTTSSRRGIPRSFVAIALATLFVAAMGQVVMAAPPDEVPGNNGTVKIHDGAGEPASEVRNEPHVCTFHLHFFFADAGDSGTWEIQEWSPGDKGKVVLNGEYMTDANGEDRDPDAGTYSLPDGHYKLFWDGDLDTNKHDKMKVFWVDCEESGGVAPETPTPTPPPPGGGAQTPTPPTVTPTPPPGGGVGPVEGTPTPTPPPGGGVGPGQGTPTPTPAGGVAAATATPAVTLPPTDTGGQPTAGSGGLLAALLFLFSVGATATLATVPVAAIQRNRRR